MLAEILAFMPAEGSAKAQSADQPQPLPQPQVEAANEQPGLKVQRLVNALWNLDRLDQRALPLDGSFSYGTATAAGTGETAVWPEDMEHQYIYGCIHDSNRCKY